MTRLKLASPWGAMGWVLLVLSIGLFGSGLSAEPDSIEITALIQPVHRLALPDGKVRFVTGRDGDFERLRASLQGPVFRAVCTNQWIPGLIPIFAVEKTNRIELRLRPARGQENFSEPLFFALPPAHDELAGRLTGHWEGEATRGGESREFLACEIILDGNEIAARFDQATQLRFASIAGGTLKTNVVELRVEYLNDVYFLNGRWDGQLQMKGQWHREDQGEQGTWQLERTGKPFAKPKLETSALYAWRRVTDDRVAYALGEEQMGEGWERSAQALCVVWK